jgi:hypothetical protein
MTIRYPTQLEIKIASKINVVKGAGITNKIEMTNETWTLPFDSYAVGSVDVDTTIDLGPLTAGMFTSDTALEFTIGANTISTKLFSYNGELTGLTVTNPNAGIVTLEYMLGTETV